MAARRSPELYPIAGRLIRPRATDEYAAVYGRDTRRSCAFRPVLPNFDNTWWATAHPNVTVTGIVRHTSSILRTTLPVQGLQLVESSALRQGYDWGVLADPSHKETRAGVRVPANAAAVAHWRTTA